MFQLSTNLIPNNSLKKQTPKNWSNDWSNDSFDTQKSDAQRRTEREQRNADKQKELMAKKQSKPMKLGSKQ